MSRSIVLVAAALLAACSATPSPTPTPQLSGPPRVSSVVAVADAITITFSRPMLQIGEGSAVEMSGNYQLDGRALPSAAKIACQTRECIVVGIELPSGTLVPLAGHTLRIANVVSQSGPGLAPDPITVSFTASPRP